MFTFKLQAKLHLKTQKRHLLRGTLVQMQLLSKRPLGIHVNEKFQHKNCTWILMVKHTVLRLLTKSEKLILCHCCQYAIQDNYCPNGSTAGKLEVKAGQ